MAGLCRDCGAATGETGRCLACGSPRCIRHPELLTLSIAHIDCDAFYASVEKRDNPELADKPVIIGGGHRGVVSAACYRARLYGVRSAMPMYKALRACPQAVVIKPNMARYVEVGRQVRSLMEALTPLVEPLSIDEAFLDLSGTERLHGHKPAWLLIDLIRRIEQEIGVTASVGLSYNKFLAKVASDLDKPRGFAVIGRAEAQDFLDRQPASIIWGVGPKLAQALARDGYATIADLRAASCDRLVARYGEMGLRLHHLARGEDQRAVKPDRPAKSISAETTFDDDLSAFADLRGRLWPLCEKVSERLKTGGLAGRTATLKLKTADFRTVTRSHRLPRPTQLADILFRHGEAALAKAIDQGPFRLIGIGAADLVGAADADGLDLADPGAQRRAQVERAIDSVRLKIGRDAIRRGRGL
ncbi:MAG: DNA polymerase IV [Alphaproteobacteria bacterium]